MAKKVVATLKTKEKSVGMAKIISTVKTEKGSYSFKEEIVLADKVQEIIQAKLK